MLCFSKIIVSWSMACAGMMASVRVVMSYVFFMIIVSAPLFGDGVVLGIRGYDEGDRLSIMNVLVL